MQSRDARKWARSRRIQLLRIAEWSARNDERTSAEYSKAGIHTELLQELSGAVSTPGQFNDAKSVWVAQLVSTLDGLNLHSKHTRETTTKVCVGAHAWACTACALHVHRMCTACALRVMCMCTACHVHVHCASRQGLALTLTLPLPLTLPPTKAGFVDRLLRVVAGQLNVRAPLLTACLNGLVNALNHADVLLAKKITYGLGGVVPLMQYISGRKYEQLAEQCGEEDEHGVVPLRLLRNKEMMAAISAVCCVIRCYCMRANEGDSDAMDTCNKLDAAGREQARLDASLPTSLPLCCPFAAPLTAAPLLRPYCPLTAPSLRPYCPLLLHTAASPSPSPSPGALQGLRGA